MEKGCLVKFEEAASAASCLIRFYEVNEKSPAEWELFKKFPKEGAQVYLGSIKFE